MRNHMDLPLGKFLAMDEVRPGEFESRYNGALMANAAAVMYGGCTVAFGISTAYATVPPNYYLYSVSGTFLGPGLVDRKVFGVSRVVRQTSSFATRLVELSQVLDNGQRRIIMVQTVDFHAQEPTSLLEYSAKPSMTWAPHNGLPMLDEHREHIIDKHNLPPKVRKLHKDLFMLKDAYFDQKLPLDSVAAQTLNGLLKHLPTTQDRLAIHEKASTDWFKTKEPMLSLRESITAAAFMMDGGLAFLPLMLNHQFLDDAGAASSLEFAFRVFRNDVKLDQWHLREQKAIAAGEGRSYSEAKLWDERGNMVASMTQQCILRPPKQRAPRKAAL